MKFGVPWSIKGIRPEARETAKEAARRSGMSLDDWLNAVIIQQAKEAGVQAASTDDNSNGHELAAVHQRLDDITRRIELLGRTGPAAYAPKRIRDEPDQLAEPIDRLDQFAGVAPPPPPVMPPVIPSVRLPPSLDRAIAEIAARQRILRGEPASMPAPAPMVTPPSQPQPQAAMAAPVLPAVAAPALAPAPVAAPAPVPLPAQDLSGLEDQLRNINDQIETLRKPGVEQAINALREELGEIGRALSDAMPRHAIDAIEKQIQDLDQRIAEGRQAGVDAGALGGIERGLAEVRDALHGLTPAENLVGFNDAVAGLAHKIDLIVAQRDPATMAQFESTITTLRDMVTHIASDDTMQVLSGQVHALGEKIEYLAHGGASNDALNVLDQRISALSDVLAERAQAGDAVPPRLETLVASLSDKIEQIQHSRDNGDAIAHLEDRIVKLVEKLDASDSRFSHLEAIERGLSDLLVHVEANKDSGPRADNSPGVDALKHDIARTQDALEAVHGTLGHVVDRLAMIEKGMRGEERPRAAPVSDAAISQPVGKTAVHAVDHTPAAAPMPPTTQLPVGPDLPANQPLEPGSGPPLLQANPAARIAASEAALGGAQPTAAAGGKSSFIAAARRAAQAAGQQPNSRAPRPEPSGAGEPERPSLRSKMIKRVKSLFIAASIIAIVVGSIQIASKHFDFGNPETQTAQAPAPDSVKVKTAARSTAPESTASIATNPLALPSLSATPPLTLPTGNTPIANTPIANAPPPGLPAPAMPSLFNPPLLGSKNDVTGSISRQAVKSQEVRPPVAEKQPSPQFADGLPTAIGGARLRSAATAGDGAAAYEVAMRFAEGRGVPINLSEAARWYERAASRGLAPAQFRYASMLEKGQGVKKDLGAARRLYLAAAAKGNSKAMHNLAVLYAEGIDGKPDYLTAVQWFRKAAQRGIADSQYNLGVLCARGLGTAKSFAEAYKWFALAAAQGDRESTKKRDEVAAHLDASALAGAQQAAKSFVPERQPEEAAIVRAPPGGWDHATATGSPPHAKPRPAAPLSLGSFQVGKQ